MDKEVWKILTENPNYQVSNLGRVKSKFSDKVLKELPGTNGYTKYCLQGKWYATHRLVANLFVVNPDKQNFTQVNHIDGDKLNNNATNLEWVTPASNIRHAYDKGLINIKRGKDHHGYGKPLSDEHKRKVSNAKKGKKLTVDQRKKLGKKVKVVTYEGEEKIFDTVRECSENIGINYWYLTKILQGRAPSKSDKYQAEFKYLEKEAS